MRNNGRNFKGNKRRMKYRKRNLSVIKLLLLVTVLLLVILVSFIRNVKAEMAEIQDKLERIEVFQYNTNEFTTEATEEIDYIDRIGVVSVGKPMKLTSEGIAQRLNILGQNNSVIGEINKNSFRYPESMLTALANNPEMADFVSGYLKENKSTISKLTHSEREKSFPLFLQWDPRWGYQQYGSESNIGLAGCGPTCISMILYYLIGNEMLTPDKIAAYAMENDYYVTGTGTAWAFMEDIPKLYDIKVTKPKLTEKAMQEKLDKGEIIICAVGEGDFTLSGHFIVIYGYEKQGFKVNDPNCVARSRRVWKFEELEEQIKSIWSYY